MMTQPLTEMHKNFQAMLLSFYERIKGADAFDKVRTKAWERVLELGLPTRSSEVFRYIRLHDLFARKYETKSHQPAATGRISAKDIEAFILPECRQSVIVCVNGYYDQTLSCLESLPKKATLSSLLDASRTFSSFLNNHLSKSIKEETDPFAAINTALHQEGLFLYLPPKTVMEAPLQWLNIIDPGHEQVFIMPRLHFFAGAHSSLNLISTPIKVGEGSYCFNAVVDATLEENSHVKYTQMACNLSDDIWYFDALRATLKKNSSLTSVCSTNGSTSVRHDYRATLAGENSEVRLNGIWMLDDKKEAHTHVLVDHRAPNCRSMQLFKGALTDSSSSSFEGKILVQQEAQKTEAFQLNNNLILSNSAHADSKPNLEIFADDVKASHGATVGQLDQDHIFYMRTRGFSESDAKNILVNGFCQEVIDLIPIASTHNAMKQLVKQWQLP